MRLCHCARLSIGESASPNTLPTLSPLEWERIPFYSDWHRHRAQLTELAETIGDVQPDGILAHHPLHLLSGKVADAERPLELVSRCLTQSRSQLDQLRTKLGRLDFPAGSFDTLGQLRVAVDYARQATFLARSNAMSILNAQSDAAKRWQRETEKNPSMRPENREEARGDAGLAGKTVAGRRRDGPRPGPPIRGANACVPQAGLVAAP